MRGMNEGYNDTLRGVFPLPDEKYLRVPVSMALHGFFGAWCGGVYGAITAGLLPITAPVLLLSEVLSGPELKK